MKVNSSIWNSSADVNNQIWKHQIESCCILWYKVGQLQHIWSMTTETQ